MSSSKRPRNTEQIVSANKRRSGVYQCMLASVPQWQMAVRYGVSDTTISQDVAYIKKNWITALLTRQDVLDDFNLRIAQLENIAQKAHAAFEKSQQDGQEQTTQQQRCPNENCNLGFTKGTMEWCPTCKGEGVVAGSVTVKRRGQAGDVSFLRLAKECYAEIAKLRGYYASQKVDLNINVEGEVKHKHIGPVTPELREAMIAAQQAQARLEAAKKQAARLTVEGEVVGNGK